MARASREIQWRAEYFLYVAFESSFRLLPISWCFRIGEFFGAIACILMKKRRHAVHRNLRAIYHREKSEEQIVALTRAVFRRSGANLLSSIKTATLPPEKIRECLVLEGLELIEELNAEGRGIIAVLAHMGNWEVLAQTGQFSCPENPSGSFYRPLKNPYLDRLIKQRRESQKNLAFSRREGMTAACAHLQEGGILGVLTDQRVGRAGVLVPYFGRLSPYTPMLDLLKRRTGSTAIGVAVITERPGRWIIRFIHPIPSDVEANSADFAWITEQILRESPVDCFWIHDRWKLPPRPFDRFDRHGIEYPLRNEVVLERLEFGFVVSRHGSFERTLRIAEHLVGQQDDLACRIFVSESIPTAASKTQPGIDRIEVRAVPQQDLDAAIEERNSLHPLFLVLTWEEKRGCLDPVIPQIVLSPGSSDEEIRDRLGANPIRLEELQEKVRASAT